ncbi:glycosyltransferase [Roseibium sp.]|uniref:glycosyltransferase n=1 Tax=Roseibium sp. TaxID=1936156 RepID=UPI003B502972
MPQALPSGHCTQFVRVATILIGRNEGERLLACLGSIPAGFGEVVYVDSGSTDDSIEAAKASGAHVVELDTNIPFTAARARNAGVAALQNPHEYLQFVDGDCALDPDWMQTAVKFLNEHPEAAVVCGRRRERFPEASVYNAMCDVEWDTPIGQTKTTGGDAMMRASAFVAVGGFNPGLIAGEEPELCVRLRALGWQVWRLDAEMTLHDAAMTRFSQYWSRSRRGGYAFAEGAVLHGRGAERHGVAGMLRALIWGVGIPALIVAAALLIGQWSFYLALVYPAQLVRLALREGGSGFAWKRAFLLTIGKFAEAAGVLEYHVNRIRGKQRNLIEYK